MEQHGSSRGSGKPQQSGRFGGHGPDPATAHAASSAQVPTRSHANQQPCVPHVQAPRCTSTHRLVLDRGREGASSTTSPTLHCCCSSCAMYFLVMRTRFCGQEHAGRAAVRVSGQARLPRRRPAEHMRFGRVQQPWCEAKRGQQQRHVAMSSRSDTTHEKIFSAVSQAAACLMPPPTCQPSGHGAQRRHEQAGGAQRRHKQAGSTSAPGTRGGSAAWPPPPPRSWPGWWTPPCPAGSAPHAPVGRGERGESGGGWQGAPPVRGPHRRHRHAHCHLRGGLRHSSGAGAARRGWAAAARARLQSAGLTGTKAAAWRAAGRAGRACSCCTLLMARLLLRAAMLAAVHDSASRASSPSSWQAAGPVQAPVCGAGRQLTEMGSHAAGSPLSCFP